MAVRRSAWLASLALVLGAAAASAAEARWRLEAALGAAASLGSTLRVEQADAPPLELDARWDTRSLEGPLYYAVRLARADARGAWALRFVHHKAYLENPTAEIERFSVSHGYNLLTLERSFAAASVDLWVGAGLVVAHPESTVRGQTLEETGGLLGGGYYVTGPTAALAAGRRLRLGARFALVPEARFTLSRARVPVVGGEASAPNAAFHFLVGLEAGF